MVLEYDAPGENDPGCSHERLIGSVDEAPFGVPESTMSILRRLGARRAEDGRRWPVFGKPPARRIFFKPDDERENPSAATKDSVCFPGKFYPFFIFSLDIQNNGVY